MSSFEATQYYSEAPVENNLEEKPSMIGDEAVYLLNLAKSQNWSEKKGIRSTIDKRDILEFSGIRRMSIFLEEVTEYMFDEENLSTLRNPNGDFLAHIIAKYERNMSEDQINMITDAYNSLVDNITAFNEWQAQHTLVDLISLVDARLKAAPSFDIDYKTVPGVVVAMLDSADYLEVTKRNGSVGYYHPGAGFGRGILEGRVIVLDKGKTPDVALRHEYQHFLFSVVRNNFDNEGSKRRLRTANVPIDKSYWAKRDELEQRLLIAEDAVTETYETGEKDATRLIEDLQKVEVTIKRLDERYEYQRAKNYIEIVGYPEGPLKDAFDLFRNEIMAYAAVDSKGKDFHTYFGYALSEIDTSDKMYGVYKEHMLWLKKALEYADKVGGDRNKIAFLVGASRNMKQAAKNIYMETLIENAEKIN